MDWNLFFNVVLVPFMGALATYIILFINAKKKELQARYNNEMCDKYLNMLEQTITSCVLATNQTYVESLKKQGKFDAEAQKIAFDKTFSAVITILSDDAYEYLEEAMGDLEDYITNRIEANVNMSK